MRASHANHGWKSIALVLMAVPLFGWLALASVPANLASTCHWKQWPVLPSCQNPEDLSNEQRVQDLRGYLANNPGDSLSYAELARFATQPESVLKSSGTAVLNAATLTAPHDATVLQLQAGQALQDADWTTAVDRLVLLADTYGNANARTALAVLVAQSGTTPGLTDALLGAAKKDQAWLESVVRAMPAAGVPVTSAMLLAGRLAQTEGLTPKFGRQLIKQLKTEGAWLDAHAIWLSLWKQPLGFLFNGDFEKPFFPDAFDWEVMDNKTYQAGAQASLSNSGKQGQVLLVKFTGRPVKTPIIRQYLILPAGEYRFAGEYQSSNLRSNEGLAWALSCGADKQALAQTPALNRTGTNWSSFNVRFRVSAECGPLVTLFLQTQAAYEAKTGQHGEMMFDHFTITRESAQ